MAVTLDMMEYGNDAAAQAAFISSLPPDPNLNLWSKLESDSDVTSPEKGVGGETRVSPTFPACKFGNGILSDVNGEGCKFPTDTNGINNSKGTIEFWGKLNWGPDHTDHHVIFATFSPTGTDGLIKLVFLHTIDDFQFIVGATNKARATTTGLSWNPGDILHFGCVWDKDGNDIGGGKTAALYVNNVEVGSDTLNWSAVAFGDEWIHFGADHDWSVHSDVVIDNVKIYNYCKTSFPNRSIENAGMGVQCFSESGIKQQGSYSLKGIADQTHSLNQTLTRTVSPTIDLSNLLHIKFEARASRTGGNFKLRIHDAGGTWSEYTVNVLAANIWQTFYWDISAIANANKDAIDSIQILITNADADNLFYFDNIFGDRGGVFITHQ